MRVVVITGAASGLGWALAQACVARGDAVVAVDRDADLLAQRAADLGVDTLALVGDLTDGAFRQHIINETLKRHGRLDVLINNAGITHRSLATRTDPAVFDAVMAVDWQAPVLLAMAALPHLAASRGSIVNIGSMAGWMPVLGRAAYCAAKAALGQFFEVLRGEVKGQGVHVLNVYPSFLDTPIERNALGADGRPAHHARSTVGHTRSADWMAGLIVEALAGRQPWLFPDRLSWFASILWRIWPAQYQRSMQKRFASELDAA